MTNILASSLRDLHVDHSVRGSGQYFQSGEERGHVTVKRSLPYAMGRNRNSGALASISWSVIIKRLSALTGEERRQFEGAG